MDIGPCKNVHSPKLLEEYKQAQQSGHPGFQDDWFRALVDFVKDCDRKVDQAQRRLDKTPEDARAVQLMREIADSTNEISTLTGQVESLGEAGKVTESMELMNKVEDLQRLKADKERELKQLTGSEGNSQQQKLRVCEVCSAYLSIFDSDRRLADHFGGKMHLGFVKIRDQVDDMKKAGHSGHGGSRMNGGPGGFGGQHHGGNDYGNGGGGGGGDVRRGGYERGGGSGYGGGYGGGVRGGHHGGRGGYGGGDRGGRGYDNRGAPDRNFDNRYVTSRVPPISLYNGPGNSMCGCIGIDMIIETPTSADPVADPVEASAGGHGHRGVTVEGTSFCLAQS
ncbi:splicing factor [Thoreauomyces humboldtii]|nr:splicing factor [Thoreauomyces humboldtii]